MSRIAREFTQIDLPHFWDQPYYKECCGQVPQEQLEPVLRVASQLKIRGLDSDYSRESSLEPER